MSISEINDSSIIKEMLLTSISCGDAELLEILEDNIDTIMLINRSCHDEIDYLRSQLSLIDLAMIYTRNRVDEARTRSQSKGFDQYRAKFENEAKAQRTSEGRTCAFADATSFQQFSRDSINRMRSESNMESNAQGNTQTTRSDRSTQSASGYSNVADFASSSSTGEGRGSSIDTMINSGRSYSKTSKDFGPNLNDQNTGSFFPIQLPTPQEIWDSVNKATAWDFVGSLIEGGIIRLITDAFVAPVVGSINFDDSIDNTYTHQNVETNLNDQPWLGCCCNTDGNPLTDCPDDPTIPGPEPFLCNYDAVNPFPSYGRGYSVKYNISVGIPFIGVLRVDWGVGQQFRQSHTMTQGCTRAVGEGSTTNIYEQTDVSQSSGSTDTRDVSQTTRDIHTVGDSFRDARSDTTAGSASTGDAHSESHTGSDRLSHSERRASNQGTAWSKGRGRGEGLSTSDSKSTTEVRHWSQIFKNLLEMYNRIFEQIRTYDKIRAASIGISVALIDQVCQYSLPKDPVVAARLRKRSDKFSLTKIH